MGSIPVVWVVIAVLGSGAAWLVRRSLNQTPSPPPPGAAPNPATISDRAKAETPEEPAPTAAERQDTDSTATPIEPNPAAPSPAEPVPAEQSLAGSSPSEEILVAAPPAQDLASVVYATTASAPGSDRTSTVPIYPPEYVDVERFNILPGDAAVLNWVGNPLPDINQLFVKQVILDDDTTLLVSTVNNPGFIGIADELEVVAPDGLPVSGHEDVAKVLERDGLLICTFQWNKERYGVPIDTRQPLEVSLFQESFIKNEAHHVGAIVPATRFDGEGNLMQSFAFHNEPSSYHKGMYGDDGFVAVAQRLVFPEFVTSDQARGYVNSVICWMGLLNPFVQFPQKYSGGDPTRVSDRPTLREFLQNGLRACLGDDAAVRFFKDPTNRTYCGEFIYIALNTMLHPFNMPGLTALLDGDGDKAQQILDIQARHNSRQSTILTQKSDDQEFEALLNRNPSNPEFDAFNIAMPVVPEDLPPLDQFMTAQGYEIDPDSLPFPPFTIGQIIRRAFNTLLPQQESDSPKIAAAQARMLRYIEAALVQQLGLEDLPPDAPQRQRVRDFMESLSQQLEREFEDDAELNTLIDGLLQQADIVLVGMGDRTRFVPPRIYVDLGQGNDETLPQGWGFRLETVGTLISRRVMSAPGSRLPIAWRELQVEEPMIQGDDVKLIQGALLRSGVDLDVDGTYGPQTAAAVKQFQTDNGLEATGVVDAPTRLALLY